MKITEIRGLDHPMVTEAQAETAATLAARPSVSACEVWMDEEVDEESMGLLLVEDGAHMTAYFDATGTIIGDWIC